MLVLTDLARPKDFHEIAGLRLIETIEVVAEPQFVKETSCAWAISVPATPDAFPIVLISDDQVLQSGGIKIQLTPRPQRLDCFNEDQICCARAKTGRASRRQDKKFSRLKMRGTLKANLGKMGDGIMAAPRHLLHFLKYQAVVIAGESCPHEEPKNPHANRSRQSLHGRTSKH